MSRPTFIFALALPILLACTQQASSEAKPAEENRTGASTAQQDTAPAPAASSAQATPAIYDVEVISSWPHDTDAFTQGLFFAGGTLYESTGQYGASEIRRLTLGEEAASASASLPDTIFGEGSTVVGDRIISLSWRAGKGFVHDLETLALETEFDIAGEGWGLTYDGVRLILSDGTDRLRFLNPRTFVETGSLPVTLNGQSVTKLNELEWINEEVWANVWQEDVIIRINPENGYITGLIDVSSLFPLAKRREPFNDVPNGIAYDPETERLLLTGKRWPKIFEVRLKVRN